MPLKEILVIGFGSDILSDEGVAIRLVNDLKGKWHKWVDFNTFLTFSLDVLNAFSGYAHMVLIDACMDEVVGKVNCFSLNNCPQTLHLLNYHDVSLKDGIEYGKKIDIELPVQIQVLTISISQAGIINDLFSKALEENYPKVLMETDKFIEDHILQLSQT